jgi:hypothetical protein
MRTPRPLPYDLLYLLIGCKLTPIDLANRFRDLFDLPFIERDVFPDGLGGQKGPAPLRSLGELVQFKSGFNRNVTTLASLPIYILPFHSDHLNACGQGSICSILIYVMSGNHPFFRRVAD